jgi:antitoxin ParD1/3/4
LPSKWALRVSLTPELLQLIGAKVQTGRYRSVSEVLRAALRVFEQQNGLNAGPHDTAVEGGRDAR